MGNILWVEGGGAARRYAEKMRAEHNPTAGAPVNRLAPLSRAC